MNLGTHSFASDPCSGHSNAGDRRWCTPTAQASPSAAHRDELDAVVRRPRLLRDLQLLVQDRVLGAHGVLRLERRVAVQQLVRDDADCGGWGSAERRRGWPLSVGVGAAVPAASRGLDPSSAPRRTRARALKFVAGDLGGRRGKCHGSVRGRGPYAIFSVNYTQYAPDQMSTDSSKVASHGSRTPPIGWSSNAVRGHVRRISGAR